MSKSKRPETPIPDVRPYKSPLVHFSQQDQAFPESDEAILSSQSEPKVKKVEVLVEKKETSVPASSSILNLPDWELGKREGRQVDSVIKTFQVDLKTLEDIETIRFEYRLQYKKIIELAIAVLKEQLALKYNK